MWLKFSERARRAIFEAQEYARRLGHCCISTEHLLLGVMEDRDNVASHVLTHLNIDREMIRSEIECGGVEADQVGGMQEDMELTPRAMRAVTLACEEAQQLGDSYVGTRHLLLGIMREGEGIAARILTAHGADLDRMRLEVASFNADEQGASDSAVLGFELPWEKTAAGKDKAHGQTGGADASGTAAKDTGSVMDDSLRGRDLLSISDLTADEIRKIFTVTGNLKSRALREQMENPVLLGKTLAMIFEKPSLRTRVTFEVGIMQLGGYAVYLQPSDIRLGERETVADAARNLERWVQGIMARTFAHKTVTDLAKYADVPVINGLSDIEHPCQALGDFYTILEHKGKVEGIKIAYVGDGNNVCHSLMLLAGKVGAEIAVACPKGFEPAEGIIATARADAETSGGSVNITNDPHEAASGADVIYTDVWASMGQEGEREARLPVFQPYQVNQALVRAAKDDVIVLHCLPAKRGEEITDEVIDGPHSAVLDQAENRLHVQKAIMALLM